MARSVKIAPSMLSADAGRMIEEVKRVEGWGASWLHIDIMDGHFAPNLTFGPDMVGSIRKNSRSVIDCHLMLSEPEKFTRSFLDAGADYVTVHAEAIDHDALKKIESETRDAGKKLAVAFKPATGIDAINLSNPVPDMVLVMSVNPGFSGQRFMPEVIPKIEQVSERFGSGIEVEVDGGVDLSNANLLKRSGATVLVAGSSIFKNPNPEKAFRELRESVGAGI